MRYLSIIFVGAALLHAQERGVSPRPLLSHDEPEQTVEEQIKLLRKKRCIPCEGSIPRLTVQEQNDYSRLIPQWSVNQNVMPQALVRTFIFKNFKQSMHFVQEVANVAEQEQHHPNITIIFNSVTLELYTHAINGLSENDFILAARIDEVAQKQRFGAHI